MAPGATVARQAGLQGPAFSSGGMWECGRFTVDLSTPRVMGIVNVTPDSFSDGGRHATAAEALAHAERLLKDGAHILDIGGESTRPGSPAVALAEELERVLPVVRGAISLGVPVSVDTSKSEVMREVLDLGADIINDVWALRQRGARDVVAGHARCGVCLMHMHKTPLTMHLSHMEGDAVPKVREFLAGAAEQLTAKGVSPRRIVLDPGIGFGKKMPQNFALLERQRELLALGYPLLAGWSRKSSLGAVTGLPVQERMVPSVVAAVLAVDRGARIVRVHDVRETVAALEVWHAAHEQGRYTR